MFGDGDDLSDSPVVDAFDGLHISRVVAAHQARHDAQALLLGQFASGRDLADADRISQALTALVANAA